MAFSQDSDSKVWAKGDVCMSPYSEDNKLYKAVIEKIHRSPTGHLTATVKFHGYGDEEEVSVAKLQEVKVKDSEIRTKRHRPAVISPGLFKPLSGAEADNRLNEKYGSLEEQTVIKSEALSAAMFSGKKSAACGSNKKNSSQKTERKKGVVAFGGEPVSRSRSRSDSWSSSPKKNSKIELLQDSDDDGDDHVETGRRKKTKEVVVTGGKALEKDKELPTSRKLSDLSSVLDEKSVYEALNNSQKRSYENRDDSLVVTGFDEDDLEKPKFNFKPEGAKVPFILSEKGQEPVVQVPATINQYLRDYQREGIKFLYSHYKYSRGAILGDDMGLGKTVQVIGFLAALLGKQGNRVDVMRQKPQFIRKLSDSKAVREDSEVISPFLIIGPGCVLFNWLEELETWGYFTVRKFHGVSKTECLTDIKKRKVEIVVTTFETFREHQTVLNKIEWSAVIADEVHKIKGLKAQTTKALRGINTRKRYGLTGTALQNNLLELWSILDWAQPGCLGRQLDFEQEYVNAIELGQRHDANKRELAEARKKKERFAEIRKGMMIRRMKTLIADQMPKKDDNVVFCRLSQLQTSIYKTILDHPNMDLVLHMEDPCGCDSGIPQSKCCRKKTSDGHSVKSLMFTFMHLLLKVSNHIAMLIPNNNTSAQQTKMARKICEVALEKHPGFVSQTKEASFQTLSDPKYCGKMKILQGLLAVFYKDHSQVLVFSYSTQALDIIEQYLMSTGYEFRRIDGSVSAKKRQIIVREFNTDPNIFVCLISTKAGGLGLNLTGANRVIIFDPNWNPTHDLQAQDRAYRIGQRRNVQVYRLVSAGTIEENMYLRQIYKQQLLNVSVEDANAKRYFYAVQGSRRQKGELFGVKNMFQLNTGSSCKTVDILKRNERVETALAGYEMTKYIPPVVRLEEDEDLEDITPLPEEPEELSESEDVFADFFSSQEAKADDEIDGDGRHSDHDEDNGWSSDIMSDSSDDLDSKARDTDRKSKEYQKYKTRNVNKTAQRLKNADITSDDSSCHKSVSNNKKKNQGVTFKSPGPCKNDINVLKQGKVNPLDSKTGKGPVKKGKRDRDNGDDNSFKVDQTLAGSFADVGDVFENCGVVHIHENVKVVGGSRAEDHMSKCAMTDVYELHQNSQDLAVQCDPLTESSEEETRPTARKKKQSVEDHNTSRSVVVDNMKVLIGQTPKGIRLKQFEKMSSENKANSLTDFAELVLGLNTKERLALLTKHYVEKEPKLTDVFSPQVSESRESVRSRKTSGIQGRQQKLASKTKAKRRAKNIDQTLGGVIYDDMSDGESLPKPTIPSNQEWDSDQGSDMDIGVKVTPVKRRKVLNQSRTKSKRISPKKQGDHVQIPPSYYDYPLSDEADDTNNSNVGNKDDNNGNVRTKAKSTGSVISKLHDRKKSIVTQNQLECIDDSSGNESEDSDALWSQLGKVSQVEVGRNVAETGEGCCCDRVCSCTNHKGSTKQTSTRSNTQVENKNSENQNLREKKSTVSIKTTAKHDESDKIREKISSESSRTTAKFSDSDNSQVSVLDDIFGKSQTKGKVKRKPAPSKGKMAKDVKHSNNVKTSKIDNKYSEKQGARFKDVNEIFCSTSADSDSDVKLETSTLKDDNYDCFDDPRKWKKRKQKPDQEPVSAVDKLISDSEAEFDQLFTAGKMKRNNANNKKEKESSSVKSFDRSASLFSN